VVQNYYYPKPGNEEAVYQWRLHASDVRTKLGLPAGRVLKKLSGSTLYNVVWECDYPSAEAREADVKQLDNSDEFKKVQEHMGTLIGNFERAVWEVQYTAPSPDEKQIRVNRIASNTAIAAHDTSGITKYWATDIFVLTSRNVQNIGKHNNAQAFINEFKTKQDVIYIRTSDRVDVSSQGNMASETGTWVGGWKDGNDTVKVTGTYYAKWIKIDGLWLIRAEIYTGIACEGERYCAALVGK
jgi:ketosteroid isomerase-like protein